MFVRPAAVLLALLASTVTSFSALAGSCPEEHVLSEARELGQIAGKGVDIEVREQIELGGWRDMEPFRMRMRHFTIQPGGQVPVHSHGDRPSILYFVSGEVIEHNSLCGVPIVHRAGETAGEFGDDVVHWWSNDGDVPVVLISVDVVPSQ